MPQQPLSQSPAYQEVVRGLLRMHQYTIEGQDESEEADALREAMGEPWERLSAIERERVAGLSKDLYTVSDPPPSQPPQPMNPQAQGKLDEAYESRERGEWDRALELWRRWGKYVPAPLLSYLRAMIWEAAGDRPVAVVFFEHACRLDPQNENFQAMFLNVLKWTNNEQARTRAEAILQESEKHVPNLVIQAADVLYGLTTVISDHEAAPIYRRLVGILTPLLSRTKDEEGLEHPTQVSMILLLLATCHRGLGETREAYGYYSRALVLEPRNDALLIARGILVYGTSPTAIADFEQAIKLNSQIVWPYFYMAHYLLSNNRLEDCRAMCERALGKLAPPRVQSELCEFLAIALTGLGYPPPVVQRAFENAIRVDPSNQRARQNLERFLNALAARTPRPIDWERPSDSYIRSSGQQQIRMAPAIYEQRKFALV
jgi:tetratricopeptide (TPR) repeat protein